MQPFAADSLASSLIQQADLAGGNLPPGVPIQQFVAVDPADQMNFERALEGTQPIVMPTTVGRANVVTSSGNATIGEAILENLSSLKKSSVAMHEEITETLGKNEINSGDMLHLQYRIMTVNLELQTTTNMAHHGVEDVKTIMRGQ